MIQTLMGWLDGKKSYICGMLWMVYKIGVSNTWWPENPQIEAIIIGGGALAFREAIKKSGKN